MSGRRVVRAGNSKFQQEALQYLELRDTVSEATRPRDKFKGSLKEYINERGVPDKDGNLVVEFPQPVKINGVTYTGLMQQKKKVPVVDEDAALELVRTKGLSAAIPYEEVRVYDWDALYRLNALKKITDEELDEVMDEDVTWALQVMK